MGTTSSFNELYKRIISLLTAHAALNTPGKSLSHINWKKSLREQLLDSCDSLCNPRGFEKNQAELRKLSPKQLTWCYLPNNS